jgi:hypothetical protein
MELPQKPIPSVPIVEPARYAPVFARGRIDGKA